MILHRRSPFEIRGGEKMGEIVDEVINLPSELELHDRVIMATARYLGTPILTKDKTLQKYHRDTIW